MKKVIVIILVIFIYSSCAKDNGLDLYLSHPITTCTTCTELNSGYVANQYCGTLDEVQYYEIELIRTGGNLGQNWTCKRK